jgi:hypothetical protein
MGASLCTKGRVSSMVLKGPCQAQDCTHGLDPRVWRILYRLSDRYMYRSGERLNATLYV